MMHSEPKDSKSAEKHIYLVRHGQSEENVDHIYRGKDAKLTVEGRRQADTVADRISRIGVEAIVSSDFERAYDTALAISTLAGVPIEVNPDVGEWLEPSNHYGKAPEDALRKIGQNAVFSMLENPLHRHHDEENFHELASRANRVLASLLAHPAERICVVTHGMFLRILVGAMLFGERFTKAHFADLAVHLFISNTGVTYVRHNEKTWLAHSDLERSDSPWIKRNGGRNLLPPLC